jgi:hypothetical protein
MLAARPTKLTGKLGCSLLFGAWAALAACTKYQPDQPTPIPGAQGGGGGTPAPSNGGSGGAPAVGGSASTSGGSSAAGGGGTATTGVQCEWARGWAAGTQGGRGGQIIKVTTLDPGGPGSLTEALATTGPRIIVFEVGGVIDLNLGRLEISEPFVTIAGQTAPSPGITLIRGGLHIQTNDVVIEHLRVRPGEAGQTTGTGWEPDGISSSTGTYNLVVDHCSVTWGVDENLSASGERFLGATADEWRQGTTHLVTFSNNIIAEGLSHSTHEKGEHSKGTLIHDNVTGALIFGNLYAHNVERNPFFKGGARGAVVNNFIANPGQYAMKYTLVESEWGTHEYQLGQMSVVGNVFHYGIDTPADTPLLYASGVGQSEVYLVDNEAKDRNGVDVSLLGGATELFIEVSEAPVWPDGFEAMPASAVAEHIASGVGARPWDRDAIDTRIVEQALAGNGTIIDSEQEVGGYAVLEATQAAFDPAEWDLDCMAKKP